MQDQLQLLSESEASPDYMRACTQNRKERKLQSEGRGEQGGPEWEEPNTVDMLNATRLYMVNMAHFHWVCIRHIFYGVYVCLCYGSAGVLETRKGMASPVAGVSGSCEPPDLGGGN